MVGRHSPRVSWRVSGSVWARGAFSALVHMYHEVLLRSLFGLQIVVPFAHILILILMVTGPMNRVTWSDIVWTWVGATVGSFAYLLYVTWIIGLTHQYPPDYWVTVPRLAVLMLSYVLVSVHLVWMKTRQNSLVHLEQPSLKKMMPHFCYCFARALPPWCWHFRAKDKRHWWIRNLCSGFLFGIVDGHMKRLALTIAINDLHLYSDVFSWISEFLQTLAIITVFTWFCVEGPLVVALVQRTGDTTAHRRTMANRGLGGLVFVFCAAFFGMNVFWKLIRDHRWHEAPLPFVFVLYNLSWGVGVCLAVNLLVHVRLTCVDAAKLAAEHTRSEVEWFRQYKRAYELLLAVAQHLQHLFGPALGCLFTSTLLYLLVTSMMPTVSFDRILESCLYLFAIVVFYVAAGLPNAAYVALESQARAWLLERQPAWQEPMEQPLMARATEAPEEESKDTPLRRVVVASATGGSVELPAVISMVAHNVRIHAYGVVISYAGLCKHLLVLANLTFAMSARAAAM